MENVHDIFFENLLASLKEGHITIQSFHYLKNPALLKSSLHPNSLLIIISQQNPRPLLFAFISLFPQLVQNLVE